MQTIAAKTPRMNNESLIVADKPRRPTKVFDLNQGPLHVARRMAKPQIGVRGHRASAVNIAKLPELLTEAVALQ
jgi:hypothetical protein